MYKPKYKKGDAIIRDKNSRITFSSTPNKTIIIDDVINFGENEVYYYLFRPKNIHIDMDQPLIPAIDVDKNYIYDEVYYRKHKLQNIIYKTKQKNCKWID